MLDFDLIAWDAPDHAKGNFRHVRANGVEPWEVEDVLFDPDSRPFTSRSSGRPGARGITSAGREIIVIYEIENHNGSRVLRPVTAFPATPEG